MSVTVCSVYLLFLLLSNGFRFPETNQTNNIAFFLDLLCPTIYSLPKNFFFPEYSFYDSFRLSFESSCLLHQMVLRDTLFSWIFRYIKFVCAFLHFFKKKVPCEGPTQSNWFLGNFHLNPYSSFHYIILISWKWGEGRKNRSAVRKTTIDIWPLVICGV